MYPVFHVNVILWKFLPVCWSVVVPPCVILRYYLIIVCSENLPVVYVCGLLLAAVRLVIIINGKKWSKIFDKTLCCRGRFFTGES